MNKLLEIKNIKVVFRKGKKDEKDIYYHIVDYLESIVFHQTPTEDDELCDFSAVRVDLENSRQVIVKFATPEDAEDFYNDVKAVYASPPDAIYTLDLNNYKQL